MGRHLQLTTSALNLADLYLTVGDIDRAHRLADIANEYIESHQLRFPESSANNTCRRHCARSVIWTARKTDTPKQLNIYSEANRLIKDLPHCFGRQRNSISSSVNLDRAEALLNQAFGLASMTSASLAVKLRMTKGAIHAARDEMAAAQLELEAAANEP